MPDIEALKQVMKIISEPDLMPDGTKWDQHNWLTYVTPERNAYEGIETTDADYFCGTAMCFAGWTVYQAGYTQVEMIDSKWGDKEVALVSKDGEAVLKGEIANKATVLLDLDDYSADDLFAASNDVEQLERIIGLIERYGTTDMDLWPDEKEVTHG